MKRFVLAKYRDSQDNVFIESAKQSLLFSNNGGKSGLQRVECQVTPGRREPTESAAENKPPDYE